MVKKLNLNQKEEQRNEHQIYDEILETYEKCWPEKLVCLFLESNNISSRGLGLLSQRDWSHLKNLSLSK